MEVYQFKTTQKNQKRIRDDYGINIESKYFKQKKRKQKINFSKYTSCIYKENLDQSVAVRSPSLFILVKT